MSSLLVVIFAEYLINTTIIAIFLVVHLLRLDETCVGQVDLVDSPLIE